MLSGRRSDVFFILVFHDVTDCSTTEQRLTEQVLRQAALAELGRLALAAPDLTTFLNSATALTAKALNLEYSNLLELLPDGRTLAFRAGFGWKPGYVGHTTVIASQGSRARYTLDSLEPVVVDDLRTDTRFESPSFLWDHGIVSGMTTAIRFKGEPLGMLGAHSTSPRMFTQDDANLFDAVAGLIGLAMERDRAEARLSANEQRFRALIENSAEGIAVVDAEGVITYVSPSATALVGYEPGEVVRRSFLEFLHPDERADFIARFEHAVREPERLASVQCRFLHKDGSWRWMESTTTSLLQRPGVQGIVANFRDITRRKEADEALRASREQLRRLAARAQRAAENERARLARDLHDQLGQALAGIGMDIDWLRRQIRPRRRTHPPEVAGKLRSMSQAVEATIGRVQAISSELRPGILDRLGLAAAVEWAAHDFERRTGIRCTFRSAAARLDLTREQATELFRICQEALTNIARHARASRASIKLARRAGRIMIQITDNGRGITDDEIEREGSLGLVGMRERATIASGTLTIARSKRKGTVVTVSVPLKGGSQA